MQKHLRANEKSGSGQVAIFAALVFQVLFIFFAMIVNVGLLIHQKINLQNSVDLAAYYGAMKQAEVLNAIAHVNYQLRQSWKLMTFRYRGMGMAGDDKNQDFPYDINNRRLRSTASQDREFKCPASFCANYKAWNFMRDQESYCRDMCDGMKITLPGNPFGSSALAGLLSAVLPGLTAWADTVSNTANQQVVDTCRKSAQWNWMVLGWYIMSYKQDMANRKRIINKLANSLAYATDDFKDLDGESARTGILKTLWKNLTYQNQANISPETGALDGGSFEVFNGLGHDSCKGTQGEEKIPPQWLSEVFVKPLYAFLDADCEGSPVKYEIRVININGNNRPRYTDVIPPALMNSLELFMRDPDDISSSESRLNHTTVGYEKNPWCQSYVRVRASTTPTIPFMPISGIKLEASSIAKPFGGRLGPWYYKNWPTTATTSQGSAQNQIDKVLPPRVTPAANPTSPNDDFQRVDYSRYVGDTVGIKSYMNIGHFAKEIYAKHEAPANKQMQLSWWDGAKDDINSPNSHGDILAWANPVPGIRTLEIGAVIPDNFDIAYYSIEPFFWRAYATRLQARSDMSNLHVRGDLGYRKDAGAPWATFSVKDQLEWAHSRRAFSYSDPLSYVVGVNVSPREAFTELLTSWHPRNPGDYQLDTSLFGKCNSQGLLPPNPEDMSVAIPGNCRIGGRTGYSVKLVDENFLISTQQLGGEGISGRIKNPPPP